MNLFVSETQRYSWRFTWVCNLAFFVEITLEQQ